MENSAEYTKSTTTQDEIIKRLFRYRDMNDFYRRAKDYGESNEFEIQAFEIEKNHFLKLHDLEGVY